jgi:PAS domain S-box-containing protein
MRSARFVLFFIAVVSIHAAHNAVRAADVFMANRNLPPMNYQEGGKDVGIVVDIFKELQSRMDSPIELRLDDWKEAQEKVRFGAVSGLAQINSNPDRAAYLAFSAPLLQSDFTIFRHKDNQSINRKEDLVGKRVGVEAAGYPLSLVKAMDGVNPVMIENWAIGFEGVRDGRLDAIIVDRWVGEYILAQNRIRDITIVSEPVESTFSTIGVRRELPDLLDEVNAALKEMRLDGTMDRILENWRKKHVVFIHEEDLEHLRLIEILVVILIVIASLLIILVARNIKLLRKVKKAKRSVDKEVQRKTQELETQRKRLEEIIWGTNVGTWEWNVQTGETIFNEKWANIIGYQLWELEPVSIETWIKYAHPDDMEESGALLQQVFAKELDHYNCEYRLRHRDGHWIWVLDRGKVVEWNEDGSPLRMAGTHTDVTYRKIMEEQLRDAQLQAMKANEAKTMFLANMSHELRTPMVGIRGILDLMLDMPDIKKASGTLLNDLDESSSALLDMLNNVLDLSKIEAGKLELDPQEAEPARTVHTSINLFRNLAAKNSVNLISNEHQYFGYFCILDDLRFRQIINNLLNNAVKFTHQGEIRLTMHINEGETKDHLTVSISDTGVGITPKQLAKIFDRFEQADKGTMKRYGGTGLGLSICSELANLMGAELVVESVEGKGTTFTFSMDVERAVSTKEKAILADVPPQKILLAEDNAINQKVVRAMLLKHQHDVTVADNGLHAVQACKREKYDVIIMDMHMPEMDGMEATQQIKAYSPLNAKTPIIAFSAYVIEENQQRFWAAGVDDILLKPVSFEKLNAKLHNVLFPQEENA